MKQCSKCKEWKDESEYHKNKLGKNGLTSQCKSCKQHYYIENNDKIKSREKQYREDNKERNKLKDAEYYINNKARLNLKERQYREEHKEQIAAHKKQYHEENKERILTYGKQYRKEHKDQIKVKNKLRRKHDALYKVYENKLTVEELPRCAEDGISLEVRCKYCGKYFIPTKLQVSNRLQALKGTVPGEQSLYCSENCKSSCPVFNQNKYPKGFKIDTSREVQAELRQMVFELDEWTCQRCGATTQEAELHCHHLTGVELNPIESADVDNCITLCEFHHDELHKRKGCTYNDFKRKACVTEEN